MKKILQALVLVCLISVTSASLLKSQSVRYLDEVFSNVTVTRDVVYAQNYEWYSNFDSLRPLVMDVYRPDTSVDNATNRPLVLLSHNGSFVSIVITTIGGYCFKAYRDSSIVELCHRFAKRGYVAVSYEYRHGWAFSDQNPDPERRTSTIIRAVYRAMQDAKACVRYFKNDFANGGNRWGIDTSKIVIGGSNSGAYVALAASALNDTTEIQALKFVGSSGQFINQDTLGDFDGFGGIQNYSGNHPGFSSRFQCALALGGAVGDTTWIQPGETPILAFHGVNEFGTKYNTGTVITSTGLPVIEVSGAGDFMPRVDRLGNNNAFKPNNFSQGPANIQGGAPTVSIEGLYPFYGAGYEPWNWYETSCYNGSSQMNALNPGATRIRGDRYIDTIMGFSAPRLYKLLIDPSYGTVGIGELTEKIQMQLFPNPTNSELNVFTSTEQKPISSIRLFDVSGRVVKEVSNVDAYNKSVSVNGLAKGTYFVSLKLTDGTSGTQKITIQ